MRAIARVTFGAMLLCGLGACFDFGGLGGGDDDGTSSDAAANAETIIGDGGDAGSSTDSDGGPCTTTYEGVCNGNRVVDVSGGQFFGCALLASGSVWCWGDNNYGQTGQPPTADLLPPMKVSGLANVTAIRSGVRSTCALEKDGTVWCWGNNMFDQLGHDPATDPLCVSGVCFNPTPTKVTGVAYAVAIGANYDSACALISSGQILCWGNNSFGQLGSITDGGNTFVPTQISGYVTTPDAGVEVGVDDICFELPNGQIECQGSNTYGIGGHLPGTEMDIDAGTGGDFVNPRAEPVANSNGDVLSPFSQFSYGGLHGCGIFGGAVTCWGRYGGPSDTYPEDGSAGSIPGSDNAAQVTSGSFHSCMVQGSTGNVLCWGNNYDYALGLVLVDAGSGWGSEQAATANGFQAKLVRGGYAQTLAIGLDDSVWVWGGCGAFADASTVSAPRRIEGLP